MPPYCLMQSRPAVPSSRWPDCTAPMTRFPAVRTALRKSGPIAGREVFSVGRGNPGAISPVRTVTSAQPRLASNVRGAHPSDRRRMTHVVTGSEEESNPPELLTAERLALAESLSAPLQAEQPFERVVQEVMDGMVPDLGDVALAVVPSARGGFNVITSARTPEDAEAVHRRVHELLPQ